MDRREEKKSDVAEKENRRSSMSKIGYEMESEWLALRRKEIEIEYAMKLLEVEEKYRKKKAELRGRHALQRLKTTNVSKLDTQEGTQEGTQEKAITTRNLPPDVCQPALAFQSGLVCTSIDTFCNSADMEKMENENSVETSSPISAQENYIKPRYFVANPDLPEAVQNETELDQSTADVDGRLISTSPHLLRLGDSNDKGSSSQEDHDHASSHETGADSGSGQLLPFEVAITSDFEEKREISEPEDEIDLQVISAEADHETMASAVQQINLVHSLLSETPILGIFERETPPCFLSKQISSAGRWREVERNMNVTFEENCIQSLQSLNCDRIKTAILVEQRNSSVGWKKMEISLEEDTAELKRIITPITVVVSFPSSFWASKWKEKKRHTLAQVTCCPEVILTMKGRPPAS